MTRKIRRGVFETNSSSTHSICIARNKEPKIPEFMQFRFGEFGWDCDTLYTPYAKASYLYTGLIANGRDEDFAAILKVLSAKGVRIISVEEPIFEMCSYTDVEGNEQKYRSGKNTGYVDHHDELKEFLDAICADEQKLSRFLFSDLSFIITGNDNDDVDVEIKVDYDYDGYYKGN